MFFDLASNSSGLSAFACIPKITKSKSDEILEENHPNVSGNKPCFANLDFDGSKILSSLPETL